jgi:hypothetical protein
MFQRNVRSWLNAALGDEDTILCNALPKVERIIGEGLEQSEPLYNKTLRLNISIYRSKLCYDQ